MSLYAFHEKVKVSDDLDVVQKELERLIVFAESRLVDLEKDFKQAHDPRAIHEIKAREEEVCAILGKKTKLGRLPIPSGW